MSIIMWSFPLVCTIHIIKRAQSFIYIWPESSWQMCWLGCQIGSRLNSYERAFFFSFFSALNFLFFFPRTQTWARGGIIGCTDSVQMFAPFNYWSHFRCCISITFRRVRTTCFSHGDLKEATVQCADNILRLAIFLDLQMLIWGRFVYFLRFEKPKILVILSH